LKGRRASSMLASSSGPYDLIPQGFLLQFALSPLQVSFFISIVVVHLHTAKESMKSEKR
jgi:hypothetical protein